MQTHFNGKLVELGKINYSQGDSVDCYVESAYYLKPKNWFNILISKFNKNWQYPELNELELEQLTNQLQADGTMYELWFEHQIDIADMRYGGD